MILGAGGDDGARHGASEPSDGRRIAGGDKHGAAARAIRACGSAAQEAILSAMNTESDRIPAKPTLDGLEDKWTQRWAKERVVQV